MAGADTLHVLAVQVGQALARLEQELANEGLATFASQLGVPLPAAVAEQQAVTAAVNRVAAAAGSARRRILDGRPVRGHRAHRVRARRSQLGAQRSDPQLDASPGRAR